jgi:hypothetical protein
VDFIPRFAAGMIFALDPGGDQPARFTGSCGVYNRRDVFLTAAHCVPSDRDVLIALEGEDNPRIVRHQVEHPTSDLALLFTDPAPPDNAFFSNQVFQRPGNTIIDGGDFICHGFPAEGGLHSRPTGRTIRGNIQRMFPYSDPAGRSYLAFEMSCPAPVGLSGSLLAYTNRPDVAIAVVTRNHDSYALIDRLEEVEKDGVVYREQISRVISYGIAASLTGVVNWLDEHLAGCDRRA